MIPYKNPYKKIFTEGQQSCHDCFREAETRCNTLNSVTWSGHVKYQENALACK